MHLRRWKKILILEPLSVRSGVSPYAHMLPQVPVWHDKSLDQAFNSAAGGIEGFKTFKPTNE